MDKVELEWQSLSTFCDKINVLRNGVTIATIPATEEAYVDESPVFGRMSIYSIVPVRNNVSLIEAKDFGSVPRNGKITGQVLTEDGLYPIKDVEITIEGTAGDTAVLETVLTDFDGLFELNDLYYDLSTEFTITAAKAGRVFDEASIDTLLNSAFPEITGLFFLEAKGFPATSVKPDVTDFVAVPAIW